jgi:hypothetical protein
MVTPKKGDVVLHRNGYRAKVVDLDGTALTNQGPATLYHLKFLEGAQPGVFCLIEDFTFPALENRREVECAVYHEAAHMAIAAFYGLTLRPDGFMVDAGGHGLSRYKTQPDEADHSREGVAVSSFAGFYADERYRLERSYPALTPTDIILSDDWIAARKVIQKMSAEYMPGNNPMLIQAKLENRSKHLVERYWPVIQELADALLGKEPQPTKILDTGEMWSEENSARFVTGEETVLLLARHGIETTCSPGEGAAATTPSIIVTSPHESEEPLDTITPI